MDYRADHAEHKFPDAPSAGFDCHSSSLAFCSSTGGKWESEFDMMMDHSKWSRVVFFLDKEGKKFRPDVVSVSLL